MERRVTGIGGIFFKVRDLAAMKAWYGRHLGIAIDDFGSSAGASFIWGDDEDPGKLGMTVWSMFPADTEYFAPSPAPFMINYRVANLDEVLEQLRAEGVEVDEKREDSEFGRFGWLTDPEGNRIELWEPPAQIPKG